MYVQLLINVGVKAESAYHEERFAGHKYAKNIYGKEYLADLTHDLTKIKKGFKTRDFMTIPKDEKRMRENNFSEISEDKIKQIDEKIGYIKHGLYMDDCINMLRNDMIALGDKNSEYGESLRKDLGIINLDERSLLEYKFNFLKEHCQVDELNSIGRIDYFDELIKVVGNKDMLEKRFGDPNFISCVDNDSKLRAFFIIRDKVKQDNIIYTISDTDFLEKVDKEYLKQKINDGMRPLSKRMEVTNTLYYVASMQYDASKKLEQYDTIDYERLEKVKQKEEKTSGQKLLESAVDATEKVTKGDILTQESKIASLEKETILKSNNMR